MFRAHFEACFDVVSCRWPGCGGIEEENNTIHVVPPVAFSCWVGPHSLSAMNMCKSLYNWLQWLYLRLPLTGCGSVILRTVWCRCTLSRV